MEQFSGSYMMDSEEFNEISFALEQHHTLFYRLWSMGKPEFTTSIPTACVVFDKIGECIAFKINPKFWASLSKETQRFVICHECKHVINKHGVRGSHLKTKREHELANIAMDICNNEDLIDRFGFERKVVDPKNEYIWADNVGKRIGVVLPPDKSFEYYYDILNKLPPDVQDKVLGMSTLDDHAGMSGMTGEEAQKILEDLAACIPDDEKQRFEDLMNEDQDSGSGRGDGPGGSVFKVEAPKVVKRKWESIITKWMHGKLAKDERDEVQWAVPNRRFQLIDTGLMLPADMPMESNRNDPNKIKVWFFLDTSGSCIGFKNRFWKAARSIPEDRFDVSLYCFDTKVYTTTLASGQVRGGGGTSLACMETYIKKHTIDKGEKYPDAIFCITDADGTPIRPLHPDRWYWFLTTRGYERNIPPESMKYMLSEYE